MKGPTRTLALAAGLAAALTLGTAFAVTPVPVALGPSSTLSVFGTSTMHAWTCTSVAPRITVQHADASATNDLIALVKAGQLGVVDVTVPVATLHSEKAGLDKNMLKAMKASQYPDVTVHLDKFTPSAGNADTLKLKAEGTLTIAGSTKSVVLTGHMVAGDSGVWLTGEYRLQMSQYGIRPPTMLMGTIRVGDPVTIRYQLLLINRDAAGSPPATTGL